jgi:hypothetical protein
MWKARLEDLNVIFRCQKAPTSIACAHQAKATPDAHDWPAILDGMRKMRHAPPIPNGIPMISPGSQYTRTLNPDQLTLFYQLLLGSGGIQPCCCHTLHRLVQHRGRGLAGRSENG